MQLRIESLTGLPINTAAQWYISYLFPGGGGEAMPAEHPLICAPQVGSSFVLPVASH